MNGKLPHTHLVAIPYPGRGHINPMMNLCKLLVAKHPNLTITFIITEEWLTFLAPTPKPEAIVFKTIPNVIPSELIRGSIFVKFVRAVLSKMESPVEELLNRLEKEGEETVVTIVADTYLPWALEIGKRRNIPVVSLWPMSPSVYNIFYHFDLIIQNGHFPADLSERGDEVVDYIPGISSMRLVDLPGIFFGNGKELMGEMLEIISCSKKAQSVICTSFEELEPQVILTLKEILSMPVYSLGPSIPYPILDCRPNDNNDEYFKWLNVQPANSVLYISLGSYLSVSREQMEEIVQGVCDSGVRYLWVARGDTLRIPECYGEMGMVVPWCEQLKVLCHSSVGGFWTHCGWNSTLEGVYSGVPMLTFPIFSDQITNSKLIVDDWKVGMRVKSVARDMVVGRKEICKIVKRFMGINGDHGRGEMRRNASELKDTCRRALSKNGSLEANLEAFARDFL
ncbi:7-deoxyloganetin glucosyltransferase [Ranunculus cassubicifolius]